MFIENNIYKTRPNTRVGGMSSRQQVLFLMQKTQKESNWDAANDSDIQDDYSQEAQNMQRGNYLQQDLASSAILDKLYSNNYLKDHLQTTCRGNNEIIPYNEEFERKRELLRQNELKQHPERLRLLAHSLTQFTPIKKNKYLERKRYMLSDKEANALVCTCQRAKKNDKAAIHQSFNCGDRCINRVVSTECCPWTCPSGPYCRNRRFQLHQDAYVYPVKTEKKGWGLLAGEFIPKGAFVMQYVGEVISVDSDLGQERVNLYKNSTCTYLMRTTNSEVIDPTFVGNIARLINHSCDPNCETQKWHVLGEVCVGIFAVKDIKENEELTFDYQFDFFKTPFTKCYCGTSKCKGYLGVLATSTASGDIAKQTNQSSISAPQCSYCKRLIIDKESLIVCRGSNKETYHISCVIKKEGGPNKQRAQAFASQLDKKTFVCKPCKNEEKKKATVNRITASLMEPYTLKAVNKQIDDKIEEEQLPWFSKDPNVRKFYDDTPENQMLDQIIAREYELIEQKMQDKQKKKKKVPKNGQEFSDYYNFMSELVKKLKSRIKQTGSKTGGYKFRRPKELIVSNSKAPQKIIPVKQQIAELEQIPRKAGRGPAKNASKKAIRIKRKYIKKTATQPSEPQDHTVLESEEAAFSELSENESMKSSEEQIDLSIDQEDDQLEEEVQSQEEGEPIEDIDIDGDDEEMEDEEQEEEESSSYSSSSDSEDSDPVSETDELNLEKLQESDGEEVKVDDQHKRMLQAQIGTPEIHVTQQKQSKFVSPRKNSNLHYPGSSSGGYHGSGQSDQQKERLTIASLVKQKIEAFVKEQCYLIEAKLEDISKVKESKLNIYEPVFNLAIPDFIDDYQCVPGFQLFWDTPWGGMVSIRIVSTFKQFNFFTSMLQELTDILFKSHLLNPKAEQQFLQYPFEILIIHVPKNFIRKLVGYQEKTLTNYRKCFTVDFDYNRDLLNDEVYQLNENTQLRVFGSSADVRSVNDAIHKELEQMKMKTVFLQMNDCKIIMDHVKEVKINLDPCEIRIKKMTREWKDLRHPFYYLPNYFRELILIGTTKEIDDAEQSLERFLQIKRELQKVNQQQISYLLPIQFKVYQNEIKAKIQQVFNNHLQIFIYEPTFPRKHLTILMIGDWKMLLGAKDILAAEVNKLLFYNRTDIDFDRFQQYTYHQQIRFSFKSLKRFVLEKDIKYLNHWDMVSIFVENTGKLQNSNSGDGEIEAFIRFLKEEDVETCINTLFVLTNSEHQQLQNLMRSLKITKREMVTMMGTILKLNIDEHKETMKYFSRQTGGFKQYFSTGQPFNKSSPTSYSPITQTGGNAQSLAPSGRTSPQHHTKQSRSRSPSNNFGSKDLSHPYWRRPPFYESTSKRYDDDKYRQHSRHSSESTHQKKKRHYSRSPPRQERHHRHHRRSPSSSSSSQKEKIISSRHREQISSGKPTGQYSHLWPPTEDMNQFHRQQVSPQPLQMTMSAPLPSRPPKKSNFDVLPSDLTVKPPSAHDAYEQLKLRGGISQFYNHDSKDYRHRHHHRSPSSRNHHRHDHYKRDTSHHYHRNKRDNSSSSGESHYKMKHYKRSRSRHNYEGGGRYKSSNVSRAQDRIKSRSRSSSRHHYHHKYSSRYHREEGSPQNQYKERIDSSRNNQYQGSDQQQYQNPYFAKDPRMNYGEVNYEVKPQLRNYYSDNQAANFDEQFKIPSSVMKNSSSFPNKESNEGSGWGRSAPNQQY